MASSEGRIMPKLILASTDVLWDDAASKPHPGIAAALKGVLEKGSLVWVMSNHAEPAWLKSAFPGVRHVVNVGRQSGEVVDRLIALNKDKGLRLSDILVLGAKDEDFLMAVNSRTLLVRAEWAPLGEKMKNYGVPFGAPDRIQRAIDLLESERSAWHFEHTSKTLDVFALTDAGTYKAPREIEQLVRTLRAYLKGGTQPLARGVLLHLLSSIYVTDSILEATADRGAVFTFYPSSTARDDEEEVMGQLCRQVRILLNGYHCQPGKPLLVRHRPATKRHGTGGGGQSEEERTNPASQLDTVHVNPYYRASGRLKGKNVVVFDDYLTYGASFGVSAALLLKAGASKVIGVAMGKFGNRARTYDIKIADGANVFAPLKPSDYSCRSNSVMTGKTNASAQLEFSKKFGTAIE